MLRWQNIDEEQNGGQNCYRPQQWGGISDRKWKFQVVVTIDMADNEQVAVSGECDALGNWLPENCVVLQYDGDENNWHCDVNLPKDKEIPYRFFICSVDPLTEHVYVRKWETHLVPRHVPAFDQASGSLDTFGQIDGVEKIDRGWLTRETGIQFKFFNNPFSLKQKVKNRVFYVKITPMALRINNETQTNSLEDSLSNDTRENGLSDQQAYSFSEVVTLRVSESHMQPQEQFGTPYHRDSIVLINVTVTEPESVAYLVDLYTYSTRAAKGEPPYHFGYHYIMPNVLKRSDGLLEIPVTCASNHRPLGMMKIEYLKMTPMLVPQLTLKESYIRYWNSKWTGLDVGHRGAGTSFKTSDGTVIRENTIASLKKAAAHGADMVEFDVQLSKDLVPVIYHDFHVYVSLKKKKTLEENDMLELPMRELTLEQLKNLKVYHLAEGRSKEAKFFDEDLEDHQPFPQLADVLASIDPHVGFNIEIKWSMQLHDGTSEMDNNIDKNLYVDCILRTVIAKAGTRRIVFSCFDPDICTMIRFKQNIYPVMFLTLGVTSKYPQYYDPRCNTIESAVCNAVAMELLGIVAHTEDLLRDTSQINLAKDQGLVVFCWGDDNNCKDTIKQLKGLGIHAIIYDKMDVLSTKETKESIFLVGTNDARKELLCIQHFEMQRQAACADPQDINVLAGDPDQLAQLEAERQTMALSTATSIQSLMDDRL